MNYPFDEEIFNLLVHSENFCKFCFSSNSSALSSLRSLKEYRGLISKPCNFYKRVNSKKIENIPFDVFGVLGGAKTDS